MLTPKKLANGMRYHLIPFDGTKAATVLVLVRVGSRQEPDSVWGGSHFIEHLMFKGTERRPNTIDISKTLDRYGAQYNAYTGKDLTGYYVKISNEHVDVAVDLLHDMLFHSHFKKEELDRERGVIIEEIKMYEENPMMHIEDLLEDAMFEGSTLGREIAGTPESIRNMDREELIAYRDAHYRPEEMVVVVAGNIPQDTENLLEQTFGAVPSGKEAPPDFEKFPGIPDRDVPRVKRQKKELEQIQIAIGFPTVGRGHKDIPAIKLLANILGGVMSSRLFIEVREKRGLCYFVRASSDAYDDVGTFVVRSGLDAKRLDQALETILEELKKVTIEGVTDQELSYAKDNIEGAMNLSLENSSTLAEFVGRQELFLRDVESPEEYLKRFEAVTLEDVHRVAKEVLNFKKMSLAAIGPYDSDESLLKHLPVIS